MAVHTKYNYKIAMWNANGLHQHSQEIKAFILNQNIDIMMVAETHFTERNYINIPNYKVYSTNHPDGKARGGTAIIIRDNIRHHERDKYTKDHLQATSVSIEDVHGPIIMSAIYCPPKHNNKQVHFEEFFKTLGNRFIAGGDYNAKHPTWGSRLTTSKGRELVKTMTANKLHHMSTYQPTYWPSDKEKVPDVIDFFIMKGIDTKKCKAESCLELSSDHSPVILTVYKKILNKEAEPYLHNKRTDWDLFRHKLEDLTSLKIPLRSEIDIEEAVERLTKNIQEAAWFATPKHKIFSKKNDMPTTIMEKIMEKRHLRKLWQQRRDSVYKRKLNRATKELKDMLLENTNLRIQNYLANLTPSEASDYSLWKATRKLKSTQLHNPPIKDGKSEWARNDKDKVLMFANHLQEVFKPYSSEIPAAEENEISEYLDAPFQMDLPHSKIKYSDILNTISKEVNIKKSPGFDLITGRIIHELPWKCIMLLTFITNAILRTNYFPNSWKVAQIIMIPKPGKKPEEVNSYRPISLLPILSKVFEKIYVKKLKEVIDTKKLIPEHQFGFRNRHGTIEQVHRLVNKINKDLNAKRYCSAAFLDVSQAFDKVWHKGILFKIKKLLPHSHFQLLKSYLTNRHFLVKQGSEYTDLYPIQSGVPQGSVLGPTLYLLYTADLPITRLTTVATFADDTAILSSHTDPRLASRYLQNNLNMIEVWLKKWRIKVNASKSVHVTFTMRRETCTPVKINNCELPQSDDAKYLGIHLDRKLTWRKHIFTKRKQLGLKLRKLYWMIGRKSKLSLENKILLYKAILKPIWTYGIQLWGTASKSNISILQRFQNKVLRAIVDAPYYISNEVIQRDIPLESINEVIYQYSVNYSERLSNHPNVLANQLYESDNSEIRRLKRCQPADLALGLR